MQTKAKFFRQLLILLVLVSAPLRTFAQTQELSASAQISILTCGPGEELYASFGHTAIRVLDTSLGIDEVYNYGTFDFNTPNFYYKFSRGKLLYSLSVSDFQRFMYTYDLEQRWVKEQLLALNQNDKQQLFLFLQRNRLPQYRDYKYDFLFDNCATKIPEVLKNVLGDRLQFSDTHLTQSKTFRDLIQQNLNYNSWSSFGIDLALGSVIDREARPSEFMFLPNYVRLQLNNSTLDKTVFVKKSKDLLSFPNHPKSSRFLSSPLFFLLLLLTICCILTYNDYTRKRRTRWFDFLLFFTTGILGCLIVFLWFMTDHSSTVQNFNICWAMPFNLVLSFYLLKKRKFSSQLLGYLVFLIAMLFLVLLLWVLGYQIFSPLLSILLLILTIRYTFLYKLGIYLK